MKETTHKRILNLLDDGQWHHSNEICQPWVGGRQGISRICELRKEGKVIKDRKSLTGRGNEYRLPKISFQQSFHLAVNSVYGLPKPKSFY